MSVYNLPMPRYPRPSDITDSLTAYVFSAARKRTVAAVDVPYKLHIGDTWLEPVQAAQVDALSCKATPGIHRYAPVQGLPEFLDAIERKLARRTPEATVARDDIQVTPGCTGAMAIACRSLLSVGEEVLLPSPYWPLIRGVIGSVGAVPVQVPVMHRIGDPDLDLEAELEARVTPRTAAIYVNSPCNPTGAVVGDEDAAAIARVAARHDLWILCDEVYEDLYYTADPPPSLWARPDFIDRAVVGHSMSKAYAMAGARVGWVHGPSGAMKAIRAMQTFHAYCAARPMQLAAARALDGGDDWLTDARRSYAEACAISADGLGLPRPAGGSFLFFDASAHLGDGDILDLLDRCREAGVTLTPGVASGADFADYLRLSFTVVPPSEIQDAVSRLQQVFA